MQITRKEFLSEPKGSVNQRKYFEGMTIELINLFQDLEVSLVVEMMKGSKKKKGHIFLTFLGLSFERPRNVRKSYGHRVNYKRLNMLKQHVVVKKICKKSNIVRIKGKCERRD